jgi:SagB-type dehydrogenase family enzyme
MPDTKNQQKILKSLINNYKNFNFLIFYKASSINKFAKKIKLYPEDWKKIYFKTYPRFKRIKIQKVNNKKDELLKLLINRRSNRKFNNYKISLKEIGYILEGAAITKMNQRYISYNSFRAYPSAGARYPLEIYLFVLNSEDLNKGLYHYNVKHHVLEFMWNVNKKSLYRALGAQSKFLLKSSLLIVITAVMKRGLSKYGERYLRFVLIESGHLAQNLLLLATKIKLKSCPIGGFKEKEILNILDISDEELELPLYIIAIGK